jgi:hypothetical protein
MSDELKEVEAPHHHQINLVTIGHYLEKKILPFAERVNSFQD